jgi:dihydrolipoamide dehydrogenase
MQQYDVLVIGSGPGGYVAAIRCAQLGLKTAVVERYATLGGTCLNVGCMPSKALLDSSEHFYKARHQFSDHGINFDNLKADLLKMNDRKNRVVQKINQGVTFLMKKNAITVIQGHASFLDKNTVNVQQKTGSLEISARNIIIATGSKPASLPSVMIDKKRIITSTEALNLKELPNHIVVIGGGVIGMELGSVFARLGTKISVIEQAPRILPGMDSTMATELMKSLKKIGFEFYLDHELLEVNNLNDQQVSVKFKAKDGKENLLQADYCLMSIGRRAYTEGLNLENIGIKQDLKGKIAVDVNLETFVKGIYAIGDVISGPMLAHKASEEGIFVAEKIAGQKPHINYDLIPGIVYTWPEVAAVGKTEEALKDSGIDYKTGIFPFSASGRAITSGDTEGLVKVLSDRRTDEILGVHIIGPRASDLIGEATVAMETRFTAEDIARISHGHPTYYEAFKEACLAAGTGAIHI